MRILFSILLANVLTACSTIELHSDEKQFSPSLGEKVLNRDVLLCKRDEISSETLGKIDTRMWDSNGLDQCIEEFGKTIGKIEQGTKVNILGIEEHKHINLFKFEDWYYIGEVSVNGKNHKFYYYYALTTTSPKKPELPNKLLWN